MELRRQLKPLGKQAEVARKASTIQSDVRDAKLRLLADDLIKMRQSFDAEVADETSLRARRDQVESALSQSRTREEQLDANALIENPQLVQAQENFYRLTAQREKFRGIQSLASERARFLSEERDEARANGRDPQSMDSEALLLRDEEKSLRTLEINAQTSLNEISKALSTTEAQLAHEENQVSAALRAIADAREGTARQEGHINGLRARIDATNAEISRLTTARDEAQARLHASRTEFAVLESEIAGVDRFEPLLDADYEKAVVELNSANTLHASLLESEQNASRNVLDYLHD